MRRTCSAFLLTLVTLPLVTACGGDSAPSLSVRWQHDGAVSRAVLPSEALQTAVYVENEGDLAIEGLVLRFDHVDTGMVPFGLSVGTATRVSSRFDGAAQVWDLGTLQPGQTMVFPISLWFDSSTVTLEPRQVSLVISAESPGLEGQVMSNALEVEVDTRAVVTSNR